MEEKRRLVRLPQNWDGQLREDGSSIPIKIRDFTPEGIGFESVVKIDSPEVEVILKIDKEEIVFKASLRWISPQASGYVGGLKIVQIPPRDKLFLLFLYLSGILNRLPASFRV